MGFWSFFEGTFFFFLIPGKVTTSRDKVGLAQGLFRVTRTPSSVWVERELHGLSFYSAGAAPYELPVFVQALSDLESRIGAPFVLDVRDVREEVRP